MGLGPFSFISLIYVVIGIRSVSRLIKSWNSVWDRNFTVQDRQLVDEAAFFVLVPVSVALHELGHAVAVWSFGGEVTDFGFYGFAGYVAFIPFGFSDTELTIVSAAGSLVNLILFVAALAVALLKLFGLRAAIKELLLQFAVVSGANAFILYPLLDMSSGLNGDWRQMYDSGVPWLTGVIIAVQLAVIAFGFWLFTTPRMKALMAQVTDVPAGMERGVLGGIRPGKVDSDSLDPEERVIREAVERVQSGWSGRVESGMQRFNSGTAMTLAWRRDSHQYAVAVRTFGTGRTDIVALNTREGQQGDRPTLLEGWDHVPTVDELTLSLRVAMETAEQGL